MLMPSIRNSFWGENLLDDFFDDFDRPSRGLAHFDRTSSLMKTDIKEDKDSYDLDIDLPGFKKENIQAELNDGYLTITAKTSEDKDEKDKHGKFIRRERYQGSCTRTFYVGEEVTQDDIKARFQDGILSLNIPKKQEQPREEKAKYISIEG